MRKFRLLEMAKAQLGLLFDLHLPFIVGLISNIDGLYSRKPPSHICGMGPRHEVYVLLATVGLLRALLVEICLSWPLSKVDVLAVVVGSSQKALPTNTVTKHDIHCSFR